MRMPRLKIAKSWRIEVTIRLLIGLIVSILFITIIGSKRAYRWELKEGDISQNSIYAPFDFSFVDEVTTSGLKAEEAAKVGKVYTVDPKVGESVLNDITGFYERVARIEEIERDETTGLSVSNLLPILKGRMYDEFSQKVKQMVNSIMSEGIISASLKESLIEEESTPVTILNPLIGVEIKKEVAEILTTNEAEGELNRLAQTLFPENRQVRREVISLVQRFLRPNLIYDEGETSRRRQMAEKKVSPSLVKIKKGRLIVDKGQIVTASNILQLNELAKIQARSEAISYISGISTLVVIFVGLLGIYLYRYVPKIFNSNQNLILIGLVMVFPLALAKSITFVQIPEHLVPVSCASILICSPMLITILLEPGVAIMATLTLAVFVGIMSANILPPAIITFVGGLVGVYSVVGIRRRWQLIKAGLLVGMSIFACNVGMGLLSRTSPKVFMTSGVWGITSGIMAAFIVTGVLPIFESLFKITTNISLLELSDLNHPLLKRLVMEAPGTYHHSLIVGNLAESASEVVGANPLLARVAAYYHDVGKIEKAEYFSENMPKDEKKGKLDKFAPSMSSLIIINHVKRGVELAQKYKLSQAIIDIVREHHGTSQVFFFYQRALERLEDGEEISKLEFRYPGPKPQTKESGIVLVADSIEAASRTLSEPTPSSIKVMVRKIINNKFIDGQLEQCELTLRDLNSIADRFVRILTGIFHTRVEYPEPKTPATKKTSKTYESKNKGSTAQGQGKKGTI